MSNRSRQLVRLALSNVEGIGKDRAFVDATGMYVKILGYICTIRDKIMLC